MSSRIGAPGFRHALLAGAFLGVSFGLSGTVSAASFTDVDGSMWYAPAIDGLAQARIVTGNRDEDGKYTGIFRPDDQVTLAEALKMGLRAAKWKLPTGVPSNLSAQGTWASSYVNAAAQNRITPFRSNKTDVFRTATRGEAAQTFSELLLVSLKGSLRSSLMKDIGTADNLPLSRAEAAVMLTRFLAVSPVASAPRQPAPVSGGSSSQPVQQPSAPVVTATHHVIVSANMRSGASMEYRSVRVLRPGDLLSVISVEGAWTQVKLLDGTSGFVISTSIEPLNKDDVELTAPNAPAPSEVQTPAPTGAGTAIITGAVNLRAKPDISSAALGSYPAGTTVMVLDASNEVWVLIRLQSGKEGYVSRKFLKMGE